MSNEELAVLAQQGDREAAGKLWEQCRRLLVQLARRFYRRYGADDCAQRGVTMADLEQECFLSLLDAVKGFKPTRGYKFTTYLSRASEGRFKDAMGLRKVNPLDMADSLNVPAWKEESAYEVGDLIPDPQAAGELESIDTAAETAYLHRGLEDGLAQLDPIQSAILRRRFYGKQPRAQVAEALHIRPPPPPPVIGTTRLRYPLRGMRGPVPGCVKEIMKKSFRFAEKTTWESLDLKRKK